MKINWRKRTNKQTKNKNKQKSTCLTAVSELKGKKINKIKNYIYLKKATSLAILLLTDKHNVNQ